MTSAPDVPGAVAGWRRWLIEDDWGAVRLTSPVAHAAWPARVEKRAHCRFGRHDAPARGCACGLWAVTDLSALLGAFARGEVIGCAALWGRVVAGERGWRGERGYPGALFVEPSVRERTRDRLARRYRVAVHRLPAAFESLVVVDRTRLEELATAIREEVEETAAGRGPVGAGTTGPAVAAFLGAAQAVAGRAAGHERRRAAARGELARRRAPPDALTVRGGPSRDVTATASPSRGEPSRSRRPSGRRRRGR